MDKQTVRAVALVLNILAVACLVFQLTRTGLPLDSTALIILVLFLAPIVSSAALLMQK